jgi:hypothetical protein
MDPYCSETRDKLHLYEQDYLQYTRCLCRGIELQLSARPEEIVRQVLLYFLIQESDLVPNLIELKVEHNNLDVAIFTRVMDSDFQPFRPPLVIVEVKREEEDLSNHEDQLLGYMKENRGRTGVLFNGNAILIYEKCDEERPRPIHLGSLWELRDRLQQLADPLTNQNEQDSQVFQMAKGGDAASFVRLVEKYGKYSTHVIVFTLKGSPDPIPGCFFQVKEQVVYYDVYAKFRRKRSSFSLPEFDKLLSLTQ